MDNSSFYLIFHLRLIYAWSTPLRQPWKFFGATASLRYCFFYAPADNAHCKHMCITVFHWWDSRLYHFMHHFWQLIPHPIHQTPLSNALSSFHPCKKICWRGVKPMNGFFCRHRNRELSVKMAQPLGRKRVDLILPLPLQFFPLCVRMYKMLN